MGQSNEIKKNLCGQEIFSCYGLSLISRRETGHLALHSYKKFVVLQIKSCFTYGEPNLC